MDAKATHQLRAVAWGLSMHVLSTECTTPCKSQNIYSTKLLYSWVAKGIQIHSISKYSLRSSRAIMPARCVSYYHCLHHMISNSHIPFSRAKCAESVDWALCINSMVVTAQLPSVMEEAIRGSPMTDMCTGRLFWAFMTKVPLLLTHLVYSCEQQPASARQFWKLISWLVFVFRTTSYSVVFTIWTVCQGHIKYSWPIEMCPYRFDSSSSSQLFAALGKTPVNVKHEHSSRTLLSCI